MRKSSRGNPYHDEKGRFCSGPKGTSEFTVSEKTSEEYEVQTQKRSFAALWSNLHKYGWESHGDSVLHRDGSNDTEYLTLSPDVIVYEFEGREGNEAIEISHEDFQELLELNGDITKDDILG